MSSKTDYGQRAAEFLKLWQESITRQMSDPEAIRAMLAAMQSFGAPPHDANARRPAAANHAGHDASGPDAQRYNALERELARLRARVDALENAARKSHRPHDRVVKHPTKPAKRAVGTNRANVSATARKKAVGAAKRSTETGPSRKK